MDTNKLEAELKARALIKSSMSPSEMDMKLREIERDSYSHEKITNAVDTIKLVCERHISTTDGCVYCPFYNESSDVCVITDLEPHNWEVNDTSVVWRALL